MEFPSKKKQEKGYLFHHDVCPMESVVSGNIIARDIV